MDLEEIYQKVLESSFRFVSFRPRTEKELRDFLSKKLVRRHVVDDNLLDRLILRLGELGYVDDYKFAEWLIEQRSGRKPKGRKAIELELKSKGIDPSITEELLGRLRPTISDSHSEANTEITLARKALERKLQAWSPLPILQKKKKIYSFLGSRGFSADIIYSVIDEVIGKDYNT